MLYKEDGRKKFDSLPDMARNLFTYSLDRVRQRFTEDGEWRDESNIGAYESYDKLFEDFNTV